MCDRARVVRRCSFGLRWGEYSVQEMGPGCSTNRGLNMWCESDNERLRLRS
jgi:hypothetical protein